MESTATCAIENCTRSAAPKLSSYPVCRHHFQKITSKQRSEEKDAEAKQRARWAEIDRERQAWLSQREQVYYVRTGPKVIKIGFTAHLLNRMKSYRLPLSTLLATEPGGRLVERERHQQFADYRYGPKREDFIDAPRLMTHIQLMRATYDTILTDDPVHEQIVVPRLLAPTEVDI